MVAVYLGIGSNINPEENIKLGANLLTKRFPSIEFSPWFESEAVGFDGDNFINLVARIDSRDICSNSSNAPLADLPNLISQLKSIENQLGRKRTDKKFSARQIDIDILLFGDLQIDSPIELPRQEILENAYVLWPLAEIAGNLKHPGSQKNYAALWDEFDKDSQKLSLIENGAKN